MSVAFRDVEAGLRRACVEVAFGTAVAPLREWWSDMAPRALLPETECTLTVLDVHGLVDPLADSALAEANLNPALVEGESFDEPESTAHASAPVAQPHGQGWITARSATKMPRLAASASRRVDLAFKPSQVASLLARHDHLSTVSGPSAAAPAQSEVAARPPARNVVQLPLRRPGEAAAQLEARRSVRTTASTIARWSRLIARSTANRVGPSASVEDVAERPQRRRPLDEPYMQSREAFDAATLARYALSEADPPRVNATLRLTDLTAPKASARSDIATQSAVIPGTASIDDPSIVPATERGSLGRVFDSLARIEQQVAGRAGHAEPATQWYDDDDGLAGRIHDILRRQVERHGINLP